MTANKGYPPTIREIGDFFGFRDKTAWVHVTILEKKGYIEREMGSPRTIKIVGPAKPIEKGLLIAQRDIPTLNVKAGDYLDTEDGYIVSITRYFEDNLKETNGKKQV